MKAGRYTKFSDFYPFYLNEHRNRMSRRLHVIGTGLAIICLIAGIVGNHWLLLAAPLIGYGFAWMGHKFFEHNRPATFSYPLFSLRGDLQLFFETATGKRSF